ncbi:hypothetical protein ABW19_dt0206678 [Dactylella cylindrospora]|nr:hypothetical protein ABW19_dt0206678 [Dactylella cylindrospora]
MYLVATLFVSLALRSAAVDAQFVGGFAVRTNDACPTEMTDCGLTGSSGDAHACCPTGQVCHNWDSYVHACCATEEDCQPEAEQANVCANDDWVLYIAGEDIPFCCPSDTVGYETYNFRGSGKCVQPGTELERGESELNIQSQGTRGSATPTVSVATSTSTFATVPTTSSSSSEETTEAPSSTESETETPTEAPETTEEDTMSTPTRTSGGSASTTSGSGTSTTSALSGVMK